VYITGFMFDCQISPIKYWYYLIWTEKVVKIFNRDFRSIFWNAR